MGVGKRRKCVLGVPFAGTRERFTPQKIGKSVRILSAKLSGINSTPLTEKQCREIVYEMYAILDLRKCDFWHSGPFLLPVLFVSVEFGGNRFRHFRITLVSRNQSAAILDPSKLIFDNAWVPASNSGYFCPSNLVKIGSAIVKLLQFYEIKFGGRPTSWT